MPHVDDLASDLQDALKVNVVAPIYTEIVMDPDGDNIDLSAYLDKEADITVHKSKDLQPGSFGKFSISEMRIKMNNKDDYFNHNLSVSPFHHTTTRLYEAYNIASHDLSIQKGDGENFAVGEKITISYGLNSDERTIAYIDTTTFPAYDHIIFAGSTMSYAYPGGSIVETKYRPGSTVTIKNYLDDVTTKVSQFYGLLSKLPTLKKAETEITLQDNLINLLGIQLKANDYRIILNSRGGYKNTISYTRADDRTSYNNDDKLTFDIDVSGISSSPEVGAIYGNNDSLFKVLETDNVKTGGNGFITMWRFSGINDPVVSGTLTKISTHDGPATITIRDYKQEGSLDLSVITIDDSQCKIGKWLVHFKDNSGKFTLTDPDGNKWTGDTGNIIYAGDAGDYQLSIAASAWDGDFVMNDEIEFVTVCSFGQPANAYNLIPEMLYRLMIEDFGAGLSSGYLDEDSFTDLISEYDAYSGGISFKEPTTILKAFELLQLHVLGGLFVTNDGTFSINVLRPQGVPSPLRVLSPNSDIEDVEQDDIGRISKVVGYYNFDQENGSYKDYVNVPEFKSGGGIELFFPAYHSTDRATVKSICKRVLHIWSRGLKRYRITEKYNTGIAFDLNEIYQISSKHPKFGGRNVVIYDIEKDIKKLELKMYAYDLNFAFGNFLIFDSDNWDEGKVYW